MPVARFVERIADLDPAQWDALHDGRNPFVAHAFLAGLEAHGCIRPALGWTPRHLAVFDDDRLVAAVPGYRKRNSHGEFVFDQAWAHAFEQHGRAYYPKWLAAVPYTPATGPRMLAAGDALRAGLPGVIREAVAAEGMSSAHVNFHAGDEDGCFDEAWAARLDVQYHWRNDAGWRGFDDVLGAMDHRHRKNIRQERARMARSGVAFRVLHGEEASDEDIAAMHGFYLRTFRDYGNTPALTLDFFRHLARAMPRQFVLFLADRDGRTVAGALCMRGGDTLYGRYWGTDEPLPGLHFETCYYQGIDYCLREGLKAFEPGAQGEHKLARGFLPTLVRSRHWIADPAFAGPIARWCGEESIVVRRYAERLAAHSPFRRAD